MITVERLAPSGFLANGQPVNITQVAQSLRISETSTALLLGEIADTKMETSSYYAAYKQLTRVTASERRAFYD